MDALKAEAHKIAAEIEEFSIRTAKEVAGLVTVISDIEDESDKMIKRERFIDAEIETLLKEKEEIKLSLKKKEETLKSLSVKKKKMDKMIDTEVAKYRAREPKVESD